MSHTPRQKSKPSAMSIKWPYSPLFFHCEQVMVTIKHLTHRSSIRVTLTPSWSPSINFLHQSGSVLGSIRIGEWKWPSATACAFSLPINNQYLYLVYDFRTQTAQPLCYSTDVTESCCDCSYTCTTFDSSTVQGSIGVACDQPLTQSYYFLYSVTNI